MDQTNVYIKTYKKIENLIRKCFPIPQKICRKTKKMLQTPEVEKYFLDFLVFVDCTEQQKMTRPINNKRRKSFYSGKKKRHTEDTTYSSQPRHHRP